MLLRNGVWWLAGLCLALSLIVPNGYSVGSATLFLISVAAFLLPKQSLSAQDKRLVLIFGSYFAFMVLFVYLDGWHIRELDRSSRFLLVLPILFLMLYSQGPSVALWVGAMFGAHGALAVATYERFILNIPRAKGGENPIMFGDISMLLGLLSSVAALYFFSKHQRSLTILASLAFVSGLTGALLSGSRGSWVAVPLIIFFLVWHSFDLLGKKLVVGICILGVAGAGTVLSVPQLGVAKRIDQAVHNVQAYINGNPNTSVGLRFEMWKANLHLFTTAPLFGVGEYHGLELKKQLAQEGLITNSAARFSHAHNEYIDALGLRGLVGFLALMAVYLVPLRLFLAKMREYKDNWNVKAYAMAGALVPMSYMDFALTQSMFSHNIGVMMYVFPIVFFWAATRWAEREAKGEA